MTRILFRSLLVLLATSFAGCASGPKVLPLPPSGVTYNLHLLKEPRPLRIHVVKIDLSSDKVEMAVGLALDPDGDGPAEAILLQPDAIAADAKLLLAVNANAFGPMPNADGSLPRNPIWRTDLPVTVAGLAAADGAVRSPSEKNYPAFWLDRSGHPHIGQPTMDEDVLLGCAGFSIIVKDGKAPPARADEPKHPRTAIGYDREGRHVWLVVVDGRQEGFSEGMTTAELGDLMAGLGCWQALNLDGGGSTVLVQAREDRSYAVINDPSTMRNWISVLRPVPVMIGVRAR